MTCALTACEISGVVAALASTYRDTCQIGARTNTQSGPYLSLTWSYATAIACGFKPIDGGESADGAQFGTNKGVVRLPRGTTVTADDRIKLVSRHGTTLSPSVVFQVVGEPNQAAFEVFCAVERVAEAGDL